MWQQKVAVHLSNYPTRFVEVLRRTMKQSQHVRCSAPKLKAGLPKYEACVHSTLQDFMRLDNIQHTSYI
jgi:hypothetical protein